MASTRNNFLHHGDSDESDQDPGYDSEAIELARGGRNSEFGSRTRKRKLSQSLSEEDENIDRTFVTARASQSDVSDSDQQKSIQARVPGPHDNDTGIEQTYRSGNTRDPESSAADDHELRIKSASTAVAQARKRRRGEKDVKPGVVYLSSLPPYLKPSALRNLLQQRGFEPVARLFLAPASKAKSTSKKNSRQLYAEGWVEFASKKTARRCAETLNANIIGGKKGGFYHDDLWNMKYLKGMGWDELMAGIREEKREEEGRRDEERRIIARETQRFLDGVEDGKKLDGMRRKRKAKEKSTDEGGADPEIKRTWRQFKVQGEKTPRDTGQRPISQDVQAVLGKIF